MATITVFGAGTWGIALARLLAVNGHDVTVWSALPEELKELRTTRRHKNLPGMELPSSMHYTADMAEACKTRDLLVFAVPSPFVRATAKKAAKCLPEGQIIVDVAKGVELGGAVKNVIALAVGIGLGLGYGDNAKAALITRGNAELARLGEAMGCQASTFAGLSGMGDLIVTCTSMHSRNLHAGMLLGRGRTADEARAEVGQVVEGMNALPAARRLAKKYKVEMPIVENVGAILDGTLAARDALAALMGRNLKAE